MEQLVVVMYVVIQSKIKQRVLSQGQVHLDRPTRQMDEQVTDRGRPNLQSHLVETGRTLMLQLSLNYSYSF